MTFGKDVSTYLDGDIDPTFAWIDGNRVLSEAIARRLETEEQTVEHDITYGHDVRQYVNAALATRDIARAQARIEDECRKDERVQDATATLTFDAATETLKLRISVTPVDGDDFVLTLAIDAVAASVLSVGT